MIGSSMGLVTTKSVPSSLVCKAVAADGNPTVKLSDNPQKAMGPANELKRYKKIFNVGYQTPIQISV